jgi:hypothetical protein
VQLLGYASECIALPDVLGDGDSEITSAILLWIHDQLGACLGPFVGSLPTGILEQRQRRALD